MKISVCFKKRPIFHSELADGEIDVISVSNPRIVVHDCRYKVDGVTKVVENTEFKFDNSFAADQTGSGKTYTMNGLQEIAVKDLFERGIDYWENH